MQRITKNTIRSYVKKLERQGYSVDEILRKLKNVELFLSWRKSEGEKVEEAIRELKSQRAKVKSTSQKSKVFKPDIRNTIYKILDTKYEILNTKYLLRYIGFAIILIFASLLGAGLYSRFFKKVERPFAYPLQPVRAGRVISFQGRLTDSLGNPITTKTDIVFKLYNVPTGGTPLYTGSCTGVNGITPDQDGIFEVLIGQDCGMSEIPANIFTENANVYLGITVGTDSEMSPRQQIANVGYAMNAETLQGLPPDTGENATAFIPFINQDGDMLLAVASPGIRSTFTSANFELSSANALTITSAGTGDIILQATGSGELKFRTGGASDLYTRMVIDNTGRVGIGTTTPGYNLEISGTGRFTSTLYLDGGVSTTTGGLSLDSFSGTTTINDNLVVTGTSDLRGNVFNSTGNLTLADNTSITGTLDVTGTTNIDSGTLYVDATNNRVGIGTTAPGAVLHVIGAGWFSGGLSANSLTPYTGNGNLSLIPNGTGDILINTDADSDVNIGSGQLFVQGSSGNVGIGTTSPSSLLHVYGSQNNNLAQIYNTNTGTSAGGLYIRIDGSGNLLTLNASGSDVLTVTPDQATFYVPTTFQGSGDVSIAYDLIFTNQTSSQILSYGPFSIVAGESFESNDLTFKTYNSGDLVFDVGIGTTGGAGTIKFYDSNVKGATDTTPIAFSSSASDINTFRSNYTNETIIGALNEVYDAATGVSGGIWTNLSSPNITYLTDTAESLVIGGTSLAGSEKLRIVGTGRFEGNLTVTTGGITVTGDSTISGTLTGLTGLTSSGTITFSGLSTGVVQANSSGVLSSVLGTANYIPKWTSTGLSTTSNIYEDANGNVGIGTNTPTTVLTIYHNYQTGVQTPVRIIQASNAGFAGIQFIGPGNTFKGHLGYAGTNTGSYINDAVYFGSIASIPVVFTSSDAERLRITSSGNVGIGTTSPQQRLTLGAGSNFAVEMSVPTGVSATATTGGSLAAGTYYIKVVASDGVGTTVGSSEVSCTVDGTTTNACSVSWNTVTGASSYRVYVGTSSNGQDRYFTTTSTSYTITAYGTGDGSTTGTVPTVTTAYVNKLTSSGNSWILGGNVGIGTVSPGAKLEVAGGNLRMTNGNIALNGNWLSGDGGNVGISIDSAGNVGIGTLTPSYPFEIAAETMRLGKWGVTSGNPHKIIIGGGSSPGILSAGDNIGFTFNASYYYGLGDYIARFLIGGSEKVRITSTGNVGIGTTSPTSKLHVEGAVTGKALAIFNETGDQNILVASASGSPKFVITNSGNVGIGTTSPGTLLHLYKGDLTGTTEVVLQRIGWYNTTYSKSLNFDISAIPTSGAEQYIRLNTSNNIEVTTNRNLGNIDIFGTAPVTYIRIGSSKRNAAGGTQNIYIGRNEELAVISGNVGIGTTSPTGKLHVEGAVTGKALAIFNETGDQNILVASASGQTKFVITNSGNVGIGTAAPTSLLHLGATPGLNYSNPTLAFGDGDTGILETNDDTLVIARAGAGHTAFLAGAIEGFAGGSNFRINISYPTTTNPIFIPNKSDSDTGYGWFANDSLVLITAAAPRLAIDSTGNVGIGTTAPAYKLDISGSLRATGGVNFSGLSASTSEQTAVLIDASNNLVTRELGSLAFSNSLSFLNLSDTPSSYTGSGGYVVKVRADETGLEFVASSAISPWSESLGVVYLETTSNKVSIGDTTTAHKLEVEGAITGKALVSFWEKGDQDILVASSGATTPTNVFRLTNTGEVIANKFTDLGNTSYYLDPANSTTSLVVAGNVGVGTAAPTSKLQVVGECIVEGSLVPVRRRRKRKRGEDTEGDGDEPENEIPNSKFQDTNPPAIAFGSGQWRAGKSQIPNSKQFGNWNLEIALYQNKFGTGHPEPSFALVRGGAWDLEFEYLHLPIEEIRPGDEVLSLDETTGQFVWRRVEKTMDKGWQPVYRVVTQSGLKLEATANHPFLVASTLPQAKPSKSTIFAVDQSGRVEEAGKDTVVAVANKEKAAAVLLPARAKRELQKAYKKLGRPRKFAPEIFAYLIVEALRRLEAPVTHLTLDIEYPGHEKLIIETIKRFYPTISFSVRSIGKEAPAHKVALAFYRHKKSEAVASLSLVGDLAAERLHQEWLPGFAAPTASAMEKVYQNSLSLSRTKTEWIKLAYLKPGMVIATARGWEKISAIYPTGRKHVYDLQIEKTHNFVAQGIVAHNTFITSSGSSPTLLLENTGTGFSFRVNDQASDTTPFVIDASGNVGIGTTSPTYPLEISSTNEKGLKFVNDGNTIAILGTNLGDTSEAQFALYGGGSVKYYFATRGTETSYILPKLAFGQSSSAPTQLTVGPVGTLISDGSYSTSPYGVNINLDGYGYSGYALAVSNLGGAATQPHHGVLIRAGRATAPSFILRTQNYNSEDVLVIRGDASVTGVGIGTTAPDAKLHVVGGDVYVAGDSGYTFNNPSSGSDLYVQGNLEVDGTIYGNVSGTINPGFSEGSVVFADASGNLAENNPYFFWDNTNYFLGIGVGASAPSAHLNIGIGSTASVGLKINGIANQTANYLEINSSTGTGGDVFVVDSNGNVGIGTTSPGAKLEVAGNVLFRPSSGAAPSLLTPTSTGLIIDPGYSSKIEMMNYIKLYADGTTGVSPGSDNTIPLGIPSFRWKSLAVGTGGITSSGNVGIGTTAPSYKLDVSGAGRFTGVLYADGGINTTSGNLTIDSAGGTTTLADNVSVSGTLGVTGATTLSSTLSVSGATTLNSTLTVAGNTNIDSGTLFVDATNNRVGIGTTAPSYKLHVSGSVDNYLGYIYNTNTGTSAGGLYVRSDGTGNLLTLNASGSDVLTVTPDQATFYVPTTFQGSGDVSLAYDLIFTNQTSSQIESYGPFSIVAGESFESNDLTLKTYNSGDLVFDVGIGTTGGAGTIKFYDSNVKGAADTTPIAFSGSSADIDTFRTNYTNETIIGALNEVYDAATGAGGGLWTLTSGVIHPTTTTNDLAIGGTSSTAPFFVNDSGVITFSGDTNLYREGANILTTDDILRSYYYIQSIRSSASQTALAARVSGDSIDRFYVTAGGTLWWSDGTTNDTNLYRSGANELKTDDSLWVTSNLGVGYDPSTISGGVAAFNGNVGIGTTSPGYKLDVVGNIRGSATYYTNDGFGYAWGDGSTVIWGTSASDYIRFRTAGTDKVTITSSGNVGIGTTSPQGKLHVYGGKTLLDRSDVVSGTVLEVIQGTGNYNSVVTIGKSGGTKLYLSGADGVSGNPGIYSTDTVLNIGYNGSTRAIVINSGNVGIGTANPGYKLDIYDATAASEVRIHSDGGGSILNLDRATSSNYAVIRYWTGGVGYWKLGMDNDGTNNFYIMDNSDNKFLTIVDNGSSGNVGIGTTSPQQRLTLSSESNFAVEMSVPTGVSATATTGGSLAAGTYYIKVVASDGAGTTVGSSEVSCTVDGTTTNACSVSWNTVTGASSYRVYVGTSSNGQDRYFTTTSTSYTITAYGTGDGSTTGTVPTVTTAYVNKLTSSGNSWILGGNVGIGTVSPGSKLEVAGGGIETSGSGARFILNRNAAPEDQEFTISKVGYNEVAFGTDDQATITYRFMSNPGSTRINDAQIYIHGDGTSTWGNYLGLKHTGTGGYGQIWTDTGPLVLQPTSGNVGIGTTSPISTLDINGKLTFEGDTGTQLYRIADDNIRVTGTLSVASQVLTSLIKSLDGSKTIAHQVGNNLYIGGTSTGIAQVTDVIFYQSGNVGIGTTSPVGKLQVVGGDVLIGTGTFDNPSAGDDLYVTGNLEVDGTIYGNVNVTGGVFETVDTDFLQVNRAATFSAQIASDVPLRVTDTTGTETFRITSSGNVGIGTTSPGAKLHVASGYIKLDQGVGQILWGTGAWRIGHISDGILTILGRGDTIDTQVLRIESNAPLGRTSGDQTIIDVPVTIAQSGTAGYTGLHIDITENSIGSGTSYLLRTSVNSTDKFYVLRTGEGYFSGNVGIGTTAPSYKLDVAGQVRVGTLNTGSTNTVVTHSSGVLQTRTIDSRVWTSGLLMDNWILSADSGTNQTVNNGETVTIAGGTNGIDTAVGATNTVTINLDWTEVVDQIDFAQMQDTLDLDANLVWNTGTYSINIDSGTLFIDGANNNVGIGTTAPAYKLEVAGTGKFSGDLTLASVSLVSDNNKVLTVDASGIVRYIDTSNWDKNASDDVTTFLGLSDTPSSYTGQSGKLVRVNTTENALEFIDPSSVGTNYWQRVSGVLSPLTSGDVIAATSSATTVATFTSTGANLALKAGGNTNYLTVDYNGNLNTSGDVTAGSFTLGTDTVSDFTGTGLQVSGGALGLTNTGVTAGTYGSSTSIPQITVDAQGRITSASNITISYDNYQYWVLKSSSSDTGYNITSTQPAIFQGTNGLTSSRSTNAISLSLGGSLTQNTDIALGTYNLTFSGGGKVGIGTNSPTSKLYVEGAVTGKALVIFNETGDQDIFVASASGSPKFVISNSGNVGIGTTSPTSFLLQTAGSIGPNSDVTYDLGSSTLQWRNIYGQAIYQNGQQVISSIVAGNGLTSSQVGGQITLNVGAGTGISVGADTVSVVFGSTVGTAAEGNKTITCPTGVNGLSGGGNVITIGAGGTCNNLSLGGSLTSNTTLTLGAYNLNIDLSSTGDLIIQDAGTAVHTFYDNGNVEFDMADDTFFVDAVNNNVGIGTTSPSQKLEVAGNLKISSGQLQLGNFSSAPTAIGTGAMYYDSTTNKIYYYNGSSWQELGQGFWQRISGVLSPATSTDSVVIGGNTSTDFVFEVSGAKTGKALVVFNETGDQDIFVASASGSPKFVISNSGNVGIGITSPGYGLHVYDKNVYIEGATSTVGWQLSSASYDNKTYDFSTEENAANAFFIGNNGTKMYVLGVTNDTVYQYTLSTAWDVSTASYDNKSFSVATQEGTPRGIFFKPDGTKMYIIGDTNGTVYQYTLSTAWDVSTASYDNVSFSVATQEATPQGIYIKSDGTKMYIIGTTNNTVYQYTLSTPWDVSTASYDNVSYATGTQDTTPQDIFFKPDGTKMYIPGSTNDAIYEYSLSTPWDVSTASYNNVSFSVATQTTTPKAVVFKDDGTKMYVSSKTAVFQYSTSTTTYTNGELYVAGKLGVGTVTPAAKLEVSGGNLKVSNGNIEMNNGNIVLNGNWLSGDGQNEGVFVAADGNVGIGTTSPTTTLTVIGGYQYTSQIYTDGYVSAYRFLQRNFITNYTAGVCWDGLGSSLLYDCNGAPSDIAEIYPAAEKLEPGDVVILKKGEGGTFNFKAYLATAADKNKPLLAVVSTLPTGPNGDPLGADILPEEENPTPIGLSGRVPVKVSLENGPIKAGDPLTISSQPGVAAKARYGDYIIGYALEDYDGTIKISSGVKQQEDERKKLFPDKPDIPEPPEGVGKILVFIQPGWYLKPISLDEKGDVYIAKNNKGEFEVKKNNRKILEFKALAEAVIGTIKAGLVKSEKITTEALELTTENLTIKGKTLAQYIEDKIKEILSSGSLQVASSKKIISPVVETEEIKLKAQNSKLKTTAKNSKLEITDRNDSPVAEFRTDEKKTTLFGETTIKETPEASQSGKLAKLILEKYDGTPAVVFDSQGNATISGQLKAYIAKIEKFETKVATVEGKLVAKEVEAENIKKLEKELKSQISNLKSTTENLKLKLEEMATREATIVQETSKVDQETFEVDTSVQPTNETIEQLNNEINNTQKLLAEIKDEPLPDVSYYQKLPEDVNIIVQKTSEVDNSIVPETSKVDQETFEVNTLVTNTLSLYSASVVSTLSVGFLSFENDRILSLSWELKLSALEKVSFFDGQVVIAKDGTITTQGQVIAKGGVKTNEISPISEGEDLTIKLKSQNSNLKSTTENSKLTIVKETSRLPEPELGDGGQAEVDQETSEVNTSAFNQKLKIENQLGDEVAYIDASGSAYFKELVLDKYLEATREAAIIAAEKNFEETGQFAPAIKTNGEIAGIGRLPAGEREIIIYNEKAKSTSLILITPTTPGFDGSLTVVEKADGFFRVVTSKVQSKDITFDWLIIN